MRGDEEPEQHLNDGELDTGISWPILAQFLRLGYLLLHRIHVVKQV